MHRSSLSIALLFLVACTDQPHSERFRVALEHGVTLHVAAAPFDSTAHTITRRPGYADIGDYVDGIDDRPFYGSDGEVPRTVLTLAELEVGGTRVPLDVSGMFNPWNGEPHRNQFDLDSLGLEGGYLVRGLFSDGAGSYLAEWEVLPGGSLRTLLTRDDRIMELLLYGAFQ